MPNTCYNCETTPTIHNFDNGTTRGFNVACSNPLCGIGGGTPILRTADEAVAKWNSYYGNHKIHRNPKYMHKAPSK